jgi:hypothetical protein
MRPYNFNLIKLIFNIYKDPKATRVHAFSYMPMLLDGLVDFNANQVDTLGTA